MACMSCRGTFHREMQLSNLIILPMPLFAVAGQLRRPALSGHPGERHPGQIRRNFEHQPEGARDPDQAGDAPPHQVQG